MSVKPRTVDNLGLDASIRYARDKELYEPNLIEDSRFISQKSEVAVLQPYIPSEFEQIFADIRTTLWAAFEAPQNFNFSTPLFTYQLIPSIGGSQKQEEILDRLEAVDSVSDREAKKGRQHQEDSEGEERQKDPEKEVLIHLLHCLQKMEKNLMLVNARRNQYQKG